MVFLCGLIVIHKMRKEEKINIDSFTLVWIVFACWSILSLFWSVEKHTDSVIVVCFETIIIICFSNFLNSERRIIILMKSTIVAAVILVLYLILLYGWKIIITSRIPSNVINSNEVGLTCAIAVSGCELFYAKEKKKAYILLLFILSIMILLTGSKSALFNLAIRVILFIFLCNQTNIRKKLQAIIFVFITILILYFMIMKIDIFYNIIGSRIENMMGFINGTNVREGESSYIRFQMLVDGLQMWKGSPLIGYGIANYSSLSRYQTYAHNNIIELLVGVGIIGTMIFYYQYFLIIKKRNLLMRKGKMDKYWNAFFWSSIICLLLNNFVEVYYHNIFEQLNVLLLFRYVYIKNSGKSTS
jgi:O-antigen ligase